MFHKLISRASSTGRRLRLRSRRGGACGLAGLLLWLGTATAAVAGVPWSQPAFVVASAGGHATGGGYTLGFTLGEPVVGLSLVPSLPLAHMAGFWGIGSGAVLGIDPGGPAPAPASLATTIAPNPFASAARIELELPASARGSAASVRLYDSHGRLVRAMQFPRGLTGRQSVSWDGNDDAGRAMPVGIYHCRIEAGPFTASRRIARVR